MSSTLSKKEMNAQIKELNAKIADAKDSIKAEFRNFGKVSKVYVKATKEYKKAKAAYDKKPKTKQERKLDDALDSFYRAHDDYREVYKLIEKFVTVNSVPKKAVDETYDQMIQNYQHAFYDNETLDGDSDESNKDQSYYSLYKGSFKNFLTKCH